MAKKSIEERIQTLNSGYKIKIRLRQLKVNKRILLQISRNNANEYEFLDLFITGDPKADDYALSLAHEIRKRKEVDFLNEKNNFRLTHNTKTDLVNYYQNLITDKKEVSKQLYLHTVNRFLRFLKVENIAIEDVSEKKVRDFIVFLERKKLSPVTIKDYYNHLKIILNRAVQDGIIQSNPLIKIKLKNVEVIKTFLSLDEIKILNDLDCERPQIKNAFLFACFTGLRISDIRELKWNNISDDRIMLVQHKTSQMVSLKLSETAKSIINEQKSFNNGEYVFHLLEKSRSLKYLKEWISKSGVKKNVSFHTARHTFATLCLTMGVDIFTVSKLLGHSDLKTTQIYAKLIDKKKDEAIDLLPGI